MCERELPYGQGLLAYVDEMEEYANVSKTIHPHQLDLLDNIPSKLDKIYFI